MSEKESSPKQLSHALATAAAKKLVVRHGEAERAVGLVAKLGACLCCLCPLTLSFPLFLGGLWAGGGAQAAFSFFCGALPLEPALQRTATQMLPAELLNLESSQKGMSISRRFFFFLGLRRSSWCRALLCSCSEDREAKVPALCAETRGLS